MEKMPRPRYGLKTTAKAAALRRDLYSRGRQAHDEGKKVAWIMGGIIPIELFTAMDIIALGPEQYATLLAARQEILPYLEKAESEGFHRDICSYCRSSLGYVARVLGLGGMIPENAADGGMPIPDIVVGCSRDCEPHVKWFQAMARYYDKPCFVYDFLLPPRGANWRSRDVFEQYIELNLDGLHSLVAFLEEQTGRKLDRDRLRGVVDESLRTYRLWDAIHELRRAVPAPMPSQDYFTALTPGLWMPGYKEATEFYQALYDEVRHKVDNKIGVVPEEKYRLMWIGFPMWFNLGIFNYPEADGGVFAIEEKYQWRKHIEVDTSDPLLALVERNYWCYEGDMLRHGRIELAQEFAKDFRVDGIVIQETKSCRQNSQGSLMAREIIKETIGLPIIVVESDMTDPRDFSFADFEAQFKPFRELVLSSREARERQFRQGQPGALRCAERR